MKEIWTYEIEDVEPEEIAFGIPDEFVVYVYDRDTYEEFEFTVTKDWLEKYDVDTNDVNEIMEFVEWYFSERNCVIS